MKNFKDGGFRQKSGGFGGRQKFGGGGDRNGNGGGKFGGGRDGGKFGGQERGRSFDKPELFSATCSTCGKACEVPFRPSADKPVYCSNCFGKKNQDATREARTGERGDRNDRGDRGDRHGDFRKDSRGEREDRPMRHEYVEAKKDTTGHDELKRQIAALESKVNRVLELLSTDVKAEVATPAPSATEEPKKIRKPKKVKVAAVAKKKAKPAAKKAAAKKAKAKK